MSTSATGNHEKKFGRLTSFNKKNSLVHIKETGEEQRPNIPRVSSGEKMSDKIYELMESYLPKDKESIQKQ
jgi:hypothetical protein